MTITAWLDARAPAPPAALRRRIDELIEEPDRTGDPAATCLEAAERALGQLVRGGDAGRAAALDLLAIDALVTYAFEAAADVPESIDERAHDAMVSLSTVANR